MNRFASVRSSGFRRPEVAARYRLKPGLPATPEAPGLNAHPQFGNLKAP